MNDCTNVTRLLHLLDAHLPETVYLMKNGNRYNEAMNDLLALQTYLLRSDREARCRVTTDELLGTMLVLEAECPLLALGESKEFCALLARADCLDVLPTERGTLCFSIGYRDAFRPAPPVK